MSITNNNSYGYEDILTPSTDVVSGIFGGLLVILIVMLLIGLAISVIMIVSMFKIFKKNGKPGWYSLIPFLNFWTLFEIAGNKGWLSLIPFVNFIFMFITSFKLSKKMGKSTGLSIVVTLFPMIGYPILAFSKTVQVVQNNLNGFENNSNQENVVPSVNSSFGQVNNQMYSNNMVDNNVVQGSNFDNTSSVQNVNQMNNVYNNQNSYGNDINNQNL